MAKKDEKMEVKVEEVKEDELTDEEIKNIDFNKVNEKGEIEIETEDEIKEKDTPVVPTPPVEPTAEETPKPAEGVKETVETEKKEGEVKEEVKEEKEPLSVEELEKSVVELRQKLADSEVAKKGILTDLITERGKHREIPQPISPEQSGLSDNNLQNLMPKGEDGKPINPDDLMSGRQMVELAQNYQRVQIKQAQDQKIMFIKQSVDLARGMHPDYAAVYEQGFLKLAVEKPNEVNEILVTKDPGEELYQRSKKYMEEKTPVETPPKETPAIQPKPKVVVDPDIIQKRLDTEKPKHIGGGSGGTDLGITGEKLLDMTDEEFKKVPEATVKKLLEGG